MFDFLFAADPSGSGLIAPTSDPSHTQFLHGSTNYSSSAPDWSVVNLSVHKYWLQLNLCNKRVSDRHKSDDPWGSYLNSDAGKSVDQGGTKVFFF